MEHTNEDERLILHLEGRITSANAPEIGDEMLALAEGAGAAGITIDATKVEYISSAGLRAIMRLAKKVPDLVIRNVSPNVYEVFEVTGFTEILHVEKARRRLSVEGCKVLGQGVEGTVYRLDPETIVKVYRVGTDPKTIEREKANAQAAFLLGIPTAISYDVVDVDGCLGVVYELLDADDLTTLINNEPERRDELVSEFARLLKECHTIELDTQKFADNRLQTLSSLDYLSRDFFSNDEIEKLKAVVANIPPSQHFCHGDAHLGNVMVQNGEMLFIDMARIGTGHPVFDLMSMYLMLKMNAEQYAARSPLTVEECHHLWDVFLRSYLETDDEAVLAKAEEQIATFSCTRFLLATIALPDVIPPEQIAEIKAVPLAAYDRGLEPVCF